MISSIINKEVIPIIKKNKLEDNLFGIYYPKQDVIELNVDRLKRFPERINNTILHELAHSTYHPNRTDRYYELYKTYGKDVAYNIEECIADITATILELKIRQLSSMDTYILYNYIRNFNPTGIPLPIHYAVDAAKYLIKGSVTITDEVQYVMTLLQSHGWKLEHRR